MPCIVALLALISPLALAFLADLVSLGGGSRHASRD
jgi:hypothetical protein